MQTERGLDRFVSFLDAVVAIAITLLVLPLTELLDGAQPRSGLGTLLADEAGQIGAFFLSFLVIARLWLIHHQVVETVGSYDRAFLAANLLWILTIVLLPFATQVSARYGADRPAIALYIGTITLSSFCLTAISLLLWRRPALRRHPATPVPLPWPSLVASALFLLAFVVGTLLPGVSYWALFLLFLSGPLEAVVRRRTTAA
ncbi:TMEM175 family protein [Geodermatophilus tzadiensis]|uniref:TMEM175 family protein n=1 Tax=Geodermatophilus tzadiensis TaxID=1137988 RepID=UPI000D067BFF|nr:TMEM175 family protein [Geodermatophilus tzadiensis]